MVYPLGQSFNVLFEPSRFDLVYGRWEPRAEYMKQLPYTKRRGMSSAYVTLDEYNNNLGLSGGFAMHNVQRAERFGNVVHDRIDFAFPSTSVTDRAIPDELHSYANAIQQSRYAPKRIASLTGQKVASEGFQNREENVSWKMIRDSCKFGIEYVVHHAPRKDRRVHFLLDGIDDNTIIEKVAMPGHGGRVAVPVTTSELRSVYRRWLEYQNHVVFYKRCVCVRPPWETNDNWSHYGIARVNKYVMTLMAAKQNHAGTYLANRNRIDRFLNGASDLAAADRHNEAVALLQHAISILDPAAQLAPGGTAPFEGANGHSLADTIRPILNDYDGQKGFFRRKSDASKNASSKLRARLNDNLNLLKALKYYLNLDSNVPPNLGARLSKSSTMHSMLLQGYRDWLGVREELDFF